MTIEEINRLLKKEEGLNLEFKEAKTSVPRSLFETVVSFSNRDGGVILLGVNDEAFVTGIEPAHVKKFKTDIVTALNDRNCINPPIYLIPNDISHTNGLIIAIKVPASSQVHDHAGRIYWREADADLDITDNQDKVSSLYFQKRTYFSEIKIYPFLKIDDLDKALFDKARSIIRGAQPSHPWVKASNEQILKESSLDRIDYQTGETGLTLAAALIFGKDQTIHSLVPAYKVEALVRRKDLDRYDDRITLRTNLIDTYLQLMDFIRKHLDERFYQEGIQRKDLRELIFREIIGNIIVHREYTSALSTDLIIYKDRVFATNPNRPYFHGPIDPIEFNPHPKNPIIRRFFTAFGWTDEIGSGIRNTNKFLTYYAPGAKPLFYEDDLFKTEIPLVNSSLIVYFDEILVWTELPDEAKGHLTSALSQISIDPILFGSPWQEVILHLVPSWHQRGIMLSELDWPKKQPVTIEDIQKVPSWHQKSTMLLHKKSRYILLILLLSSEPIKLEMLMKWLSYSNRSTFRKNYLNPLQKAGLVRMTNPDNPKDPDQKYITTEQGKLFLAGRAMEML